MKDKLSLTLLILFLLFGILSLLVQSGLFLNTDLYITIGIQKIIPRAFDLPLSLFSLLGSAEIVSLIFLILLLISKNLNKLLVLSLYVLTGVIELIGKTIISQEAPPISFLRTYQFFEVPSGSIAGHFFSYPSGHSARSAFVSTFLLFIIWENKKLSRKLKYTLTTCVILFDFIMFGSRVYLGEHWITDVIGGAILGFSLFLAGFFFSRRLRL